MKGLGQRDRDLEEKAAIGKARAKNSQLILGKARSWYVWNVYNQGAFEGNHVIQTLLFCGFSQKGEDFSSTVSSLKPLHFALRVISGTSEIFAPVMPRTSLH